MLQHKISWLVESRVIYLEVWGAYDIETVRQVVSSMKDLVDESIAPVHVVWDMSRMINMTKDLREPINEMADLRYHPKRGWITIITNNVMIRFAGQIVSHFLGANYRSVGSFEEAIKTLCSVDRTIAAEFEKVGIHAAK